MQRLGTLFIAFCMVIVSGSLGALLYLVAGVPAAISGLVALTLLLGLAWWQFSALRTADRADLGGQIGDLSSTVTDVARALADVSRRVADLDGRLQVVERAQPAGEADETAKRTIEPLVKELAVLSGLVKDLAETAASHEQALERLSSRPPVVVAPAPASPAAPAVGTTAEPAGALLGAAEPPAIARRGPLAGLTAPDATALVRRAVQAGRIEIYLQPIVTLPQRKVRFYEALPRVRAEDGSLLEPADYRDLARADRLEPEIELQVLLRCVQVVRRLATRNREIGLFLDLSLATLTDGGAMARHVEFLEANRALAAALVFQVAQATLRGLGPIEADALAAVTERGFALAVDHITDLRFDARELGDRGVRYAKVPAGLLLDRTRATGAEIHPADLADLLGRHGIDLIGEGIETEGQVVDLLDYELKYGQGIVFAPPKPVRADVFASERRPPAREGAPDAPGAPAVAPPLAAPAAAAAPAEVPAPPVEQPAAPSALRRLGGLAELAKTVRRA